VKLLTFNIQHGGGTRVSTILDNVLKHNADTVVLTEFRQNKNAITIKENLYKNGYIYSSSSSLDPKKNSVFIASKFHFITSLFPLELKEDAHRALFAQFKDINILGVYFAQKELKRNLFNFINNNFINLSNNNGLVIGDFNTGNFYEDEKNATFSCTHEFNELKVNGLVDSWRSRNKGIKEFSWYSHAGNGFRIDHIFSTTTIDNRIKNIYYSHNEREQKISDHSAMIVEIANKTE